MKVTRRDVVGGAGMLAFQAIAGSARAETDMNSVPFAATAPTHVSKVGIKARDADQLAKYYREVVGLRELSRKGQTVILGAGETSRRRRSAPTIRIAPAFITPLSCCRAGSILPGGRGAPSTSARRLSAHRTILSARPSI
jgi:hypothetical protein